jgi:hypothetical protein
VLVCVSRRDCLVLMPGVEAGARREGGATGTGTEGVATADVGESVNERCDRETLTALSQSESTDEVV